MRWVWLLTLLFSVWLELPEPPVAPKEAQPLVLARRTIKAPTSTWELGPAADGRGIMIRGRTEW